MVVMCCNLGPARWRQRAEVQLGSGLRVGELAPELGQWGGDKAWVCVELGRLCLAMACMAFGLTRRLVGRLWRS